jgi:hypothetical protein
MAQTCVKLADQLQARTDPLTTTAVLEHLQDPHAELLQR